MTRLPLFIVVALLVNLPFQAASAQGAAAKSSSGNRVAIIETVMKRTGRVPDFTYRDGSKVTSFAEMTAGKVVVLNFWTTWCGPCRKEIPDLIELSREMAPKGVIVVGMSLDQADNRSTLVKGFVDKMNIPYPNFLDNSEFQLAEAFGGIQSVPTTYIIDRKGVVVQRIIGSTTKAAFAEAVGKAL